VGRASYSHSRGGSICACRYGGFRVVGRLLGLLGNLSPLNSSRGTTTLVVVPTTVPDVGLIPILWGCSAALFPTSQMSLPCVVVFSLVVLLALTLQCTRHGSRFGPVLYSVSRSINLIPNPNPTSSRPLHLVIGKIKHPESIGKVSPA